jgi:malate dehydrogenase
MTREDLIGTNAGIVKTVAENLLKYSPDVILIVISNPMDTMTYLALQATGLPKNRIIGMGGTLDSSRFKYQLSQHLGASPSDLNALVVGGHGDTTMIPLIRMATWNSVPVTKSLTADQQKQIVNDTMVGGATLTKLIGTSAWYAPGAAGAALVYGQKDICMGVPVIIGKNGWEKIIDFDLNKEEQAAFNKSADAVRNMNSVLKTL